MTSLTGTVTLNSTSSIGVAANTLAISGIIGGVGGLTYIGPSTLSLSGANTYGGPTTINSGNLEFANVNAMSASSAVTVNAGGTLSIAVGAASPLFTNGTTGNGTIGGIFSGLGGQSGSTVTLNPGSTVGIDTTSASVTYAGSITNAGVGLTKLGTNSLILTAAETYTGPTTISAGTLQLGNATAGNNGSLATPSIVNNAALLFEPATGTTITSSANIGGSGTLTVTGAGGTVKLAGAGTFTGATSVTAGTLDVANSLALQNGVVGFTAGTGAITFDSAVTSNAFTFGGLTTNANNSYVLQNTASNPITLTIGNPSTNITSATTGVISGPGNLTVAGFSSTLQLVTASTYTGTTTVTGATLNLGGSISGSSASPLVLGGFANGGILAYTRAGTVIQTFGGTTINAGENAITESTATQTINLGAITSNGGGTFDLSSTGTITTTNGNIKGILGGYATYGNKTTWAVAPSTPGGAITGLAAGSYTETGTAINAPANYTAQNVDVNASATPTAAITPNTIRFNSATAYTLTLTGVNAITAGGILQTTTASNGGTITGGTLTGSTGGQLAITNGSAVASLSLSSLIVDNGTPTAVAASGLSGGGYVNFYNINNSFSGGLYFNGGRLSFTSGGTAFGTGNVTFGNQIYTGAGGGGINFGANSVASGLLVDAQGTNASNGDISSGGGTGNWTLIGTGTATFAGIIGNYASGRVVNLTLDSGTQIIANTEIGSSAVTVNGGIFQVGNGYVGAYSNANNNVALNVGGGTFVENGNLAGTTSQPFNSGLVVNAGASTVSALNNSGAGTLVSFNAAGSRAAGGTVNFVLPGGTQNTINGFTTVNLNTNGILGGYATVGGTDWATNATNLSGGNIIGLSSSTINSYSATPSALALIRT